MTYHQIEEILRLNASSICSIQKHHLHVTKFYFLWVPYSLNGDRKIQHTKRYRKELKMFVKRKSRYKNNIVTVGDT